MRGHVHGVRPLRRVVLWIRHDVRRLEHGGLPREGVGVGVMVQAGGWGWCDGRQGRWSARGRRRGS